MRTLLYCVKVWVFSVVMTWAAAPTHVHATTAPGPGTVNTPFWGWLDRSGTATADTVEQQATWEPFTGWKSWGFGPEPVWLRVTVPAAVTGQEAPQILIVRPTHLDRVTFYDPATRTVKRSGDFLPATDDALGSVLFTFEVPTLPAARTVWLRVESSSTRTVHLSLMPQAQAQFFTRWVEWATGSMCLLSTVFFLWSFLQWRRTRDHMMGVFAFKQFAISAWGFLFLGFARVTVGPWFADGVLSLISSVLVAFAVSSTLWFLAALLAEYQARPWMLRVLRTAAWIVLALNLLHFFGQTALALRTINIVAPFLLLWVLLTIGAAQPGDTKPPIPKAWLFAYLSGYVFLNALPALSHTGVIPESPILFLGNISVMVTDGLVMLMILNVRQRRFNALHQSLATQMLLQQEQARMDKQYLDEQRKLLAMLTHEMKTPLANLRLWMEAGPEGRTMMERAIYDMNQIIERCAHTGQLSDKSLRPRPEWLDAAELTQTVATASRQRERVTLQLPDDICMLHADAQMTSIVLTNLLENAYKYSAPDTPVSVRLEAGTTADGAEGWYWRVENAVGVAGFPDASQVFEKYYRSPHAQRQSGSGLGLYLVKSLLHLMKGHATYVALEGRVRFDIWLPCEAVAYSPDRSDPNFC